MSSDKEVKVCTCAKPMLVKDKKGRPNCWGCGNLIKGEPIVLVDGLIVYTKSDYDSLKQDLESLIKSVFDSLSVTSIRNDEVYKMEELAQKMSDKYGIKYE